MKNISVTNSKDTTQKDMACAHKLKKFARSHASINNDKEK